MPSIQGNRARSQVPLRSMQNPQRQDPNRPRKTGKKFSMQAQILTIGYTGGLASELHIEDPGSHAAQVSAGEPVAGAWPCSVAVCA